MAKAELTTVVTPKCQRWQMKWAMNWWMCALIRRTRASSCAYVDRPEGMSLDDCERYHRAIMPLVESYDFDFLEVSSPGIDRPLKKDRDFERALGEEVEVHLFKAVDGQKVFTGILSDFDAQDMVLTIAGEEKRFARKAASLVKPVVDMEGVEDVDLV